MALTPAQIRNAIDTALANLWPKVQGKQATYLAGHGRYWQGIFNPAAMPADGNDGTPDGTLKPYYQAESWADFLGVDLPATLKYALQVDQYITPDGQAGFVGYCYVSIAGNVWCRAQNSGPESWRTFGWTQL